MGITFHQQTHTHTDGKLEETLGQFYFISKVMLTALERFVDVTDKFLPSSTPNS